MKYAGLLSLLVLLVGCARREDEAPKPVVAVKLARAERADLRISVRAPATVFAREQANVSSRMTAPIRQLKARKGDAVSAGEILAVLENRDVAAQREEARAALADAQASLQKLAAGTLPTDIERARGQVISAEAALNQARQYYQRRSELFKQGAIPGRELLASETELAQAKAAHDVARRSLDLLEHQSRENDLRIAESRVGEAKARLQLAEVQGRFTEIRSPFSGMITEQFMFPGDMAKPDTPMFTVMDLSIAVARAQVPEGQAGAIQRGQACSFDSIDGSRAGSGGRITVVNMAVDPARRTVEVWCEIPNAGHQLRAGAFGNVTVVTGTAPQAVVVPLAAVQFNEGTRTGSVYVADEKRIAHKVEVETGERAGGRVQIVKGIEPGDAVIVEGAYGLPDGTQVQVQTTAPEAAK
ncbi:MAG: efflux RND transporter periplasmic adaptor subunit [Acidobacteria bacterium]|nr:efflux RND transporter periplasmic adaptor subunit [Acidobacteriota bacterium]